MTDTTPGSAPAARERFTDADLTHRWAIEHRIPVLTGRASWRYLVALIVPHWAEDADPSSVPETWNLYNATWPDDDEAAILGSYIDYRASRYAGWFLAKMRSQSLDAGEGINTFTFVKHVDGWRYTKDTFQSGDFYPDWDKPEFEPNKAGLVALIGHLHGGRDGKPYSDLAEWMVERPDVWG